MKMVKSLLLGTAAGVVAVSMGQAADLPVKAKPVEYVKVCSLYGAGFYYMPGTDMCIKIGGWVRAEFVWGGGGSMTWGPFNGVTNNITTNNMDFRARGYITADAREQTAYGTARAYIAVGINTNDAGLQVPDLALSSNRAFIQWAGITAGLAQSFYDFYSVPIVQYRGGYLPASDTGDPGWFTWGYTAQLGNGLSATIAAESRRTGQIINQTSTLTTPGSSTVGNVVPGAFTTTNGQTASSVALNNGNYGGFNAPDVVANLRLDQTWGGAQIMGALHEVNPEYFSGTTSLLSDGHPGIRWGWVLGAGLRLNFPMIAQGDFFQTQFNYTQGALRYLYFTPNGNYGADRGVKEGYGVESDCVFGGTLQSLNTTGCKLTTAWGFNASYEHYWTPQWHQSFYGAYYATSYNSTANAMLCGIEGNPGTTAPAANQFGALAIAGAGCNNNWSTWGVGSRLQWDVTKSFYMGVEVLYQQLKTATLNAQNTLTVQGTVSASPLSIGGSSISNNVNNTMISVRMHKDFLP